MDDSAALHTQAIQAALQANWEQALKLNQQIIEIDPKNVDALNRIALAYFELGDLVKSKKHYEESLKYDPYNQIASKFVKRIETLRKKGITKSGNNHSKISTDPFIEEPGKTTMVNLLKTAEPQKLSLLSSGLEVNLITKNHCICITNKEGEYLGILPDDLSHKLIRLIRGGNKYQAFINGVKVNGLAILIRELFRAAKFKNQPSFNDSSGGYTYSSDHINLSDDADTEYQDQEDTEEEIIWLK